MKFVVSIDFGCAFTKVAIRGTHNHQSKILTDSKLVFDSDHCCIPTLAAVDSRKDTPQWVFGHEAANLVDGRGVRVYRNWKPHLFKSNRGKYKEVTVEYFKWLFMFVINHIIRSRLYKPIEIEEITVRLCVPAFSDGYHVTGKYSKSEEFLRSVLNDAIPVDPKYPILTEPATNAIGIYTEGKNVTWTPPGTTDNDIKIHVDRMMEARGYFKALNRYVKENDAPSRYYVLVLDIGAYTTDIAFINFDLNNPEKQPTVNSDSAILGIQDMTAEALELLPSVKVTKIKKMDARRLAELRNAIFAKESTYKIDSQTILGEGSESRLVQKAIERFVHKVKKKVKAFLHQHKIEKVNELILTGGGNLIPRIASSLREGFMKHDLGIRLIHSPINDPLGPNPTYHHNCIAGKWARCSTAVGGASIFFEQEYW